MARVEHMREVVNELPTAEEVHAREGEGWKLVAVEWQRDPAVTEQREPDEASSETWCEAPYGLETPTGDSRLLSNSTEAEAMQVILSMVIDDRNSLARVAEELNRRGFHTRQGGDWSQGAVFNMLPRLVEVAPEIYASSQWRAQATAHPV